MWHIIEDDKRKRSINDKSFKFRFKNKHQVLLEIHTEETLNGSLSGRRWNQKCLKLKIRQARKHFDMLLVSHFEAPSAAAIPIMYPFILEWLDPVAQHLTAIES